MSNRETASSITALTLDESDHLSWDPKMAHERDVAIFDLLEVNHFGLNQGPAGPYSVNLELRNTTLIFHITSLGHKTVLVPLALRPLKGILKDYFAVCETYFSAIRGEPPSRIEAIDVERRALHDEGAKRLVAALVDHVTLDRHTARRLFTLVCVLLKRH